ncbi:MAG: hypothetical protein EZS28_028243, partial [Streblomastix strix]
MGCLMCLWARVKLYLGNASDAIDKLSLMDTTSQASETDYFANMLWAFAEQGNFNDVGDQLEVYSVTQASLDTTAVPFYVKAKYTWAKEKNRGKCIAQLDHALVIQLRRVFPQIRGMQRFGIDTFASPSLPPSGVFYSELDPSVVLCIIRSLINHLPSLPISSSQTPPLILQRLNATMRMITNTMPHVREVLFIQAYLLYLSGRLPDAQKILSQCLSDDNESEESVVNITRNENEQQMIGADESNHKNGSGWGGVGMETSFGSGQNKHKSQIEDNVSGYIEASLLLSRIMLENGDLEGAKTRLNDALAREFNIRKNTSYCIIMGQALVRSRIPQDIEEGKKMLLNTL